MIDAQDLSPPLLVLIVGFSNRLRNLVQEIPTSMPSVRPKFPH
jgi:hypothetical protein